MVLRLPKLVVCFVSVKFVIIGNVSKNFEYMHKNNSKKYVLNLENQHLRALVLNNSTIKHVLLTQIKGNQRSIKNKIFQLSLLRKSNQ